MDQCKALNLLFKNNLLGKSIVGMNVKFSNLESEQ